MASPPVHLAFSAQSFQGTEVDRQAIELLAPRVGVLSVSLSAPIHPGDINEKTRGEKLEQ